MNLRDLIFNSLECDKPTPLGLENGRLADHQFNASSAGDDMMPHDARLNQLLISSGPNQQGGCWAPTFTYDNSWLQVVALFFLRSGYTFDFFLAPATG